MDIGTICLQGGDFGGLSRLLFVIDGKNLLDCRPKGRGRKWSNQILRDIPMYSYLVEQLLDKIQTLKFPSKLFIF